MYWFPKNYIKHKKKCLSGFWLNKKMMAKFDVKLPGMQIPFFLLFTFIALLVNVGVTVIGQEIALHK